MFTRFLIKFLLKLLDLKTLPSRSLTEEQKRGLMAEMYQNQSMRTYLDDRERYLIDNGMERFINGKLSGAHGLAGQLIEVRNLRSYLKACYNSIKKEQEEKKGVPTKVAS